MRVPEWWEVHEKCECGDELNPLEQFVHDQEPAGSQSEEAFRRGLEDVLEFVSTSSFGEGFLDGQASILAGM